MTGAFFLQIVLIFLNAVFASAEIAVISMNEMRLKSLVQKGDSRAVKLFGLTEQPARFLATIQVAITLAGLLGSAFAAENFAGILTSALMGAGITVPENILNTFSVFIITLLLAYFNLVFGELVPKRIAMKKAEALALGMSGMLFGVSKIFAPLVWLLTVSTNVILRLIGIDPKEEEEAVSEEEIRMMLSEGNVQGTIQAEEREMIQNIFEFDDLSLEQIGTHRKEVMILKTSDSLEAWEEQIHGSRHTYYPIAEENQDDIIGIMDTRDYFRIQSKSKEQVLEQALEEAWFVPESMKANVLFKQMKHRKKYFAVMVDEYGGMSGIVTLHDLMEALVGDLEDESEERPKEIVKISDGRWQVLGSANLKEVAEEIQLELPTDIYDTYSGFVCGAIGRVPKDGEQFTCEVPGLKIQVNSVKQHRIEHTIIQTI